MKPFHAIQGHLSPTWKPQEVRLVYLTFRSETEGTKRCQTLATSLDEAMERVFKHYGPGSLCSWGTRCLPIEGMLVGGGVMLPGRRDIDHADDLTRIRS